MRTISDKASVDLGCRRELTLPTVTEVDPTMVQDPSPSGRQVLDLLKAPCTVLALFVGDATRLLPGKPVAVGAVWHVTLPNTTVPEFVLPTAVQLESVTTRVGDTIATLRTTSLVRFKGRKTITSAGVIGGATVTKVVLEAHGTIVLT